MCLCETFAALLESARTSCDNRFGTWIVSDKAPKTEIVLNRTRYECPLRCNPTHLVASYFSQSGEPCYSILSRMLYETQSLQASLCLWSRSASSPAPCPFS